MQRYLQQGKSHPNNTVILHLCLLLFFFQKAHVSRVPQLEIENIPPWHFCLAHEQTIQIKPRSHLSLPQNEKNMR